MARETRLVLVTGLPRQAAGSVAEELRTEQAGTVLVRHDLTALTEGVVKRRLRWAARDETTVLELAHGCVSCTLREDLLPLLRTLVARPDVHRVVLHLDPVMEPEQVCWALRNALVGNVTIVDLAPIEAVLAVVDERTWLAAATGDERIDDERTLAEVAVGQVEFADAIVVAGSAEDRWVAARTRAVLDRLAPTAPRAASVRALAVPDEARRGVEADAHAPLLGGSPPLDTESGVSLSVFEARRPFHPTRLYRALDVLLDGVVRAKGRFWVATQPDVALWVASAGGGLRIGHAGAWLAAVDEPTWSRTTPERRAKAAVDWHPRWGDRIQEIAVLAHDADPADVHAALHDALLTDAESAAEPVRRDDPFTAREPLEDKA